MLTLLVLVAGDLGRLAILLQSLKHFMDPSRMKMMILTPRSYVQKVMKAMQKMNRPQIETSILTDEQLYPFDRDETSSWERQQVLKLLASKAIDTDFYLIFDCDVFATKPFSFDSLIQNGKGMIDMQSSPGNFQDIENVSKLFDFSPPQKEGTEVMKVTPAILSTQVVKDLLSSLEKKSTRPLLSLPEYLYECISMPSEKNESVTEYMIYFIFALRTGKLWEKHFRGELVSDNSVWFPHQCFEWNVDDTFGKRGYFCVFQGNFKFPFTIVFDQIRDRIGRPREVDVPRISCLMVTKDRLPLARTAIECFRKQTYPNKELVVVCDSPDGVREHVESLNDERIVVFQLPSSPRTLGELRNFSIEKATGDFVAQWDDDDWYHPSRLSIQFGKLKENGADACLLGQWLMAWPGIKRYAVSASRNDGWEGTILARKNVLPRYQNLRKFEDTEMMRRLSSTAKVHVVSDPDFYFLYVYLVHGNNTWDKEHFRDMFDRGVPIDRIWSLPEKTSETMASLLGMKHEGYVSVEKKEVKVIVFLLAAVIGVGLLIWFYNKRKTIMSSTTMRMHLR